MPNYQDMLSQLINHMWEGGDASSFPQSGFNNLIDFQKGGAGFGNGLFSGFTGLSGLSGNPYMQASNSATATLTADISIINPEDKKGFMSGLKSTINTIGGKTKEGLGTFWNSAKSGGAAYDLLLNGMSAANVYMNKDLNNSKGFNTVNNVLDVASSIGGKINPLIGLGIKGIQTGLNAYNNLTALEVPDFKVDRQLLEQFGGAYSGSVNDMLEAEKLSGQKFGGANKKGFNEASDKRDEAYAMQQGIEAIGEDLALRDARSANIQANAINYQYKLNKTTPKAFIVRNGMKLDNVNRAKRIKVNHKVNVDTKQVEIFTETDSVDSFKEGGMIDFKPIIYNYTDSIKDNIEFVPIINFLEELTIFKEGGKTEESELVKLEETSQKNVIPEGALHKNKHHIENTKGLTLKGIPVIDNDGEQQAEIELDEIIFTLEVTKKLEELHKIFKEGTNKEKDDAAIEAGKLLVQEILYNTDDRTGLISKCEKGGKLWQS